MGSIEALELGVSSWEFLATDSAVAVTFVLLAGGFPAVTGLSDGCLEPAEIRTYRFVLENGRIHIEPLRAVGPCLPHRPSHLRGLLIGLLGWHAQRWLAVSCFWLIGGGIRGMAR